MKLSELLENTDVVLIYLDPTTKSMSLNKNSTAVKRGMVTTVRNKKDYTKLKKNYKLSDNKHEIKDIINDIKSKNVESQMRLLLSQIQQDSILN